METYYFIAGEFCPEGMGYNYFGRGSKYLIVTGKSYTDCYDIAMHYGESVYGKSEYKDLWYGDYAYTWRLLPQTKQIFADTYKRRLETVINQHYIINGCKLTNEKLTSVYNKYIEDHSILEVSADSIKAFSGDIKELLNVKDKKEVKFEGPFIDVDSIIINETEQDKEFFN